MRMRYGKRALEVDRQEPASTLLCDNRAPPGCSSRAVSPSSTPFPFSDAFAGLILPFSSAVRHAEAVATHTFAVLKAHRLSVRSKR